MKPGGAADSWPALRLVRVRRGNVRRALVAVSLSVLAGCQAPGGSSSRGASRGVAKVDLTQRAWFPPVVRQQGNSCAQQAGLYYLLAAELNRQADRRSTAPGARLSAAAAYSQLADSWQDGSHVPDGWMLARETGVPRLEDWPRLGKGWMDGFDRYRRALLNRPAGWTRHPLRTLADLRAVKDLLAAGHPVACDFQVRDAVLTNLPPGSAGAGIPLAKRWGTAGPGHVMVYAGYDDSVGYDFNGDGRITNDVDITGDGRVTLADQERGAFLAVNPWTRHYGASGRVWAPWREHELRRWPRAGEVATVTAARPAAPRLMLRLKLRVPDRRPLVLTTGVARRADARAPDQTWSPLPFRRTAVPLPSSPGIWEMLSTLHRPGRHLSAGSLTTSRGGAVEIGLDLTPLAGAGDGRWFLDLADDGTGTLRGEILEAAVVRLDSAGGISGEIPLRGPGALTARGVRWQSGAPP